MNHHVISSFTNQHHSEQMRYMYVQTDLEIENPQTNRNKSYRRLSDEQNMMNLDESFTFCSSDQHHSEQMRYSACTPLGIKTEILPMQRKQDETRTKQKDGNTSG